MSVIRVKKEQKYFVAANAPFQDKNLSWEARGVMGYLLSKPNGWECRNYDLVNQGPTGEHAVKRIIKELKVAGYIHRFKISKGRGKIEWITEIYESPELNPHFTTGDFTTVVNTTGDTIEVEKSADIVSTDSQKVLNQLNTDFSANSQKSESPSSFVAQIEEANKNLAPPQEAEITLVGHHPNVPQYTDTKRADLNTLGHYIADQFPKDITTRKHLKAATLLGYDVAQLCKLDVAMLVVANDRAMLTTLANTAIALDMKKATADMLTAKFSPWWYAEDWRGKRGQTPSPKAIIETWGQFEAAKVSPPPNGSGPVLTEAEKARMAELMAGNE